MSTIEIFGKKCGKGHRPLIVAELSGNHGGNIQNALDMIDAAAKAGADAVKIQSYTPDTITIDHDGPEFVLTEGLWKGRTLYDLYKEAHTPFEWHPTLFAYAKEIGIPIFSSPFDETAVALLESLNCPAYKIASFEIIDLGLIELVAQTGKPVIISTGMASLDEIQEAIDVFNAVGNHGALLLLHCTSGYPTPINEANLLAINALSSRFAVQVGLSDHTQGNTAAIAASALGACMIEKHFMLSKENRCVDTEFSIESNEFLQLVYECNSAYQAMGKADSKITNSEKININKRRSLYAVKDIRAGSIITKLDVRSIRPGFGLHPRYLNKVIGSIARMDIPKGTSLHWDLLEEV